MHHAIRHSAWPVLLLCALLAWPASLAVSSQAAEACAYGVTDLGTLEGPASFSTGLNGKGHVVGGADVPADTGEAPAPYHPFLWRDGQMIDLGTLGGDHGEARRINERGQIAGLATPAPGQELTGPGTHAFLWDDGQMTDLGTLGGEFSWANGINEAGQLTGGSETADGEVHVFLWEEGAMRDLGLLPGWKTSYGIQINEAGQIAGFTAHAYGVQPEYAFFYENDTFTDIGTLGGRMSEAFGLNEAGQVAGWANYTSDATPDTDGSLPAHAFLWQDGVLTDLNDCLPAGSPWELQWANGINAAGQIAGTGLRAGTAHAVLLTPTS